MYLNNENTHKINLINFLYNLECLTYQKNIKIWIIASFPSSEDVFKNNTTNWPNLNFAKGNLVNVCINESSKDDYEMKKIKEDVLLNDVDQMLSYSWYRSK